MDTTANTSLTEKYNRLSSFASKFWPEISTMSDQSRLVGTGDVISFLYTLPLSIIGTVWLIWVTDLEVNQEQFLFLIFNLALFYIFSRMSFFTIFELRTDRYGSSEDSLASMVLWSAIFLLGPTAIWVAVIYTSFDFIRDWRHSPSFAQRWNHLRSFSTTIAVGTIAVMLSLVIYTNMGGEFPIPGLTLISVS